MINQYSNRYRRMLASYEAQQRELEKMLSRQKEDIIGETELNKIRVEDCGEDLVRIVDYVGDYRTIIQMTEMRKRFPNETLYARRSVAEQLKSVADEICPLRLKFFDAFRPIELQQRWFDDVYNKVKRKNPSWSEEQARAEAFIYVFPPSMDPQTPPPHSTGAALDLTLTDKNGNELDMGTRYAEFDNPLMYTNQQGLSEVQKANRLLLMESMVTNGFVNYPGEWWHWSFGDREWVAYLGKPELPAIFGRAEDPLKTALYGDNYLGEFDH